ncbi:YccJ family protein [Shigella flexneri]
MPTQEAKADHVGEWASPAQYVAAKVEGQFSEVAGTTKRRKRFGKKVSDEVLVKAFAKTDKDSLFWGEQTIERKNV